MNTVTVSSFKVTTSELQGLGRRIIGFVLKNGTDLYNSNIHIRFAGVLQ